VTYETTTGFLDRNKDVLVPAHPLILQASSNAFIKVLHTFVSYRWIGTYAQVNFSVLNYRVYFQRKRFPQQHLGLWPLRQLATQAVSSVASALAKVFGTSFLFI